MLELVEVSPRDGLQNEAVHVPTRLKVELVERLLATGVRRMEVTSFVHPERVPQLADAEAVMAAVPRPVGVSYAALVLNERGARRAVDAGAHEVDVVVLCTDTFGRRNQGGDLSAMIERQQQVTEVARTAGLRVTVTLAAAFGCPFEGEVATARVAEVLGRVLAAPPDELALADTIGVGVPTQVRDLTAVVRAAAPALSLRFHFHNTRNTGYANVAAAVEAGASAIDASAGGIGGCPFAPGATGNVATEDVLYLLDRSGVATGVDGDAVAAVGTWLGTDLGLAPPALLGRSPAFPPRA